MKVEDFLAITSHLPNDAKIYISWANENTERVFMLGYIQYQRSAKIYHFDDSKDAYISSIDEHWAEQITLGDVREEWSNIALDYHLNLHLSGGYGYVARELSKVLINQNDDILLLCER